MVDRTKTLIEFITAWADYERRMSGIGLGALEAAKADPALRQMVSRITDELMRSPDVQRDLAMKLAIAEFSRHP